MNLKLIHIKYKFYIQIILFVTFLLLASLVTVILVNKNKEAQSAVTELASLPNLEAQSRMNYQNFITHLYADDSFYQTGNNSYSQASKTTLVALKDTLNYLTTYNSFAAQIKKMGLSDTLTRSIYKVKDSFTIIEHILKDIGNVNHGNVRSAIELQKQLYNTLAPYSTGSIGAALANLQRSESAFIYEHDQQVIYSIANQLQELQNDSIFYTLDYFTQDEIRQIIISYTNVLTLIHKSREQLGIVGNMHGLYENIEIAYNQLEQNIDEFLQHIKTQQQRYTNSLVIIGITIIILLSVLYLYLFIRFFKQVSTPLSKLGSYTYQLAKGQQNIAEIDTNVPAEFTSVITNLKTIFESINAKKLFVDKLLKQNFDVDLALQGKHDKFGKTLLALKENMRKTRDEELRYAEENRKRQYQNEGLAKFAEILRQHSDNLTKLADTFIKEIVRYLGAIQGGLFLLENEGDTSMYLAAAFAYNRKKHLVKEIKIGQTLVGTCALEKKTTVLDRIPENYIEITSGLGDAPPNNLILVPIMHDEILIGVLEVASLKAFGEIQVALCEKICESLASTIINTRVNARTNELLQKSQQQAAEMAEQEEEMRQNMEELQATQEESLRREEELEGFLEAIDQTFYVIEYDNVGSVIKVNQRFLYLTDLEIDKVIGKTHQQIFGKSSTADSGFFANVADGNIVELSEKVMLNEKKLEIKNIFTPIKTKSGETVKILNIMSVIV